MVPLGGRDELELPQCSGACERDVGHVEGLAGGGGWRGRRAVLDGGACLSVGCSSVAPVEEEIGLLKFDAAHEAPHSFLPPVSLHTR